FGYDMIVTCNPSSSSGSAFVSRIDPAGHVTFIQTTGPGTKLEGPAVAPVSFGPPPGPNRYGGQILVADENIGAVHAIDNLGNVTLEAFDVFAAEGVLVIPSDPCTFANSSGTLFSAAFDQNAIYRF